PPVQTPPSPKWSSGSLPVSPAPSIAPSPISSPMISLTIPSPVASPATVEAEGCFAELGAQVEIQEGLIRDHMVRLGELSPALFERYDRDIGELFTRALWRLVLELEAWVRCVDTWIADMSRAKYDDHRLVHDMLLQQATLQQELQEMRGRITALEKERDFPPPYTVNFMPPTPDLSYTGLDEFVNKLVPKHCKAKSSKAKYSKEQPKVVRNNNDAPIIKKCVSDDEEENVSQPKIKRKQLGLVLLR
nr:hypothetical protein [Tanacetum cinerariifolium]